MPCIKNKISKINIDNNFDELFLWRRIITRVFSVLFSIVYIVIFCFMAVLCNFHKYKCLTNYTYVYSCRVQHEGLDSFVMYAAYLMGFVEIVGRKF